MSWVTHAGHQIVAPRLRPRSPNSGARRPAHFERQENRRRAYCQPFAEPPGARPGRQRLERSGQAASPPFQRGIEVLIAAPGRSKHGSCSGGHASRMHVRYHCRCDYPVGTKLGLKTVHDVFARSESDDSSFIRLSTSKGGRSTDKPDLFANFLRAILGKSFPVLPPEIPSYRAKGN